MSQPAPCLIVRIAIALAALKYKPRDQSTASYLLDLQSHFPGAAEDSASQDWRTYALQLEKQLATLKSQRDADQELLSKLPADVSTSDAPPPKKKSKKNTVKDQHDPGWGWDQSRAGWSRCLSSQYPSSPSLVATYASLKGALAAPDADRLSYASRLTDAILRALHAIRLFLFSPPNPRPDALIQAVIGAPLQLKPEHIDSARIALASPLFMYILRTALHTLVRTAQDIIKSRRPRQRLRVTTPISIDAHAYIDMVLDHLLDDVLLSLLRAIAPLCSARLAPLVSAPLKKNKDKDKARTSRAIGKGRNKDKDKDKDTCSASAGVDLPEKTDVRTDVYALIGTSLAALDALPPLVRPLGPGASANGGGSEASSIAGGIRDRLGLETIRELEALYAVPPPPPLLPPASVSAPSSSPRQSSQPPPPTPTTMPSEPPPPPSAPSSSLSLSQPRPRTPPRAPIDSSSSRAEQLERLAGTRAERVRALATRDAGWFLASTLSLCAVPPAPAPAGRSERLGGFLREALLERIGKLVRSVPLGGPGILDGPDIQTNDGSSANDALDRGHATASGSAGDAKFALDPVCQNILLAICERAVSYLVSP